MKYGYIRVSTKGQAKDGNSLEAQEKQLRDAGAEKIYKDVFTGEKINRPQLTKLLKKVEEGDTVIVTTMDRLARDLIEGFTTIRELLDKGIAVNILNMGVMDSSPTGQLTQQIFLAFAEYERKIISERMWQGKVKSGNYGGRPKIETERMNHAMQLLNDYSYKQVQEMTGISKSSLVREKKRRNALQDAM